MLEAEVEVEVEMFATAEDLIALAAAHQLVVLEVD